MAYSAPPESSSYMNSATVDDLASKASLPSAPSVSTVPTAAPQQAAAAQSKYQPPEDFAPSGNDDLPRQPEAKEPKAAATKKLPALRKAVPKAIAAQPEAEDADDADNAGDADADADGDGDADADPAEEEEPKAIVKTKPKQKPATKARAAAELPMPAMPQMPQMAMPPQFGMMPGMPGQFRPMGHCQCPMCGSWTGQPFMPGQMPQMSQMQIMQPSGGKRKSSGAKPRPQAREITDETLARYEARLLAMPPAQFEKAVKAAYIEDHGIHQRLTDPPNYHGKVLKRIIEERKISIKGFFDCKIKDGKYKDEPKDYKDPKTKKIFIGPPNGIQKEEYRKQVNDFQVLKEDRTGVKATSAPPAKKAKTVAAAAAAPAAAPKPKSALKTAGTKAKPASKATKVVIKAPEPEDNEDEDVDVVNADGDGDEDAEMDAADE